MLRALPVPVLQRQEQVAISTVFESEAAGMNMLQPQQVQLYRLKTGLMQDLLTDGVSVVGLATGIILENPA